MVANLGYASRRMIRRQHIQLAVGSQRFAPIAFLRRAPSELGVLHPQIRDPRHQAIG
jgi:hypothetical protein